MEAIMVEKQELVLQRTHEFVADRGIVELHQSAKRGEAFEQVCDFIFQLDALAKARGKAEKGRGKNRSNILAAIEAQEIEIRGAIKRLAYRHHPLGVV